MKTETQKPIVISLEELRELRDAVCERLRKHRQSGNQVAVQKTKALLAKIEFRD